LLDFFFPFSFFSKRSELGRIFFSRELKRENFFLVRARFGFFLGILATDTCFLILILFSLLSIAHPFPNHPKNQIVCWLSIGAGGGCTATQQEEQKGLGVFVMGFFFPSLATRVVFHRPFSRPTLDHTLPQSLKKHKSFVGFQVAALVDAW